jgi:hypothetical protein
MNYLTESHGFTRPPSLLYRILAGMGQGAVIVIILCWAFSVACWDTIVGGKSAADQMEGKR